LGGCTHAHTNAHARPKSDRARGRGKQMGLNPGPAGLGVAAFSWSLTRGACLRPRSPVLPPSPSASGRSVGCPASTDLPFVSDPSARDQVKTDCQLLLFATRWTARKLLSDGGMHLGPQGSARKTPSRFVPNHAYIAPARKISAASTKLRPLLQIARKPPAGRGPTGRGVPGTAQSRARRVGRGGGHLGRPGGGGRPAGGRPAAVGSRSSAPVCSARL
jgi:hypothetical protein